jgi:Na+/phosphate symporter
VAVGRAGRAISPITRETHRESGEIVREFDLRSAAAVLAAAIGAVFLIFFLAAFVPWLLANGMTAAIEGMMHQVGFSDFRANTLGDWILVLFIGAVFTAFIVAVCVTILMLYNVLSQRTGMGLRVVSELPAAEEAGAIEAPAPTKRASSSSRKVASSRKATGAAKRSGTRKSS